MAEWMEAQGFNGTGIDVTEHEELTKALRKSEAELRQMLDFTPQLVSVYGPNRERLHINRIALDYLDLSLEEWRQTPERCAFVHPDGRARERDYFDRALSTGSAYELELRLRKGDGSYRVLGAGKKHLYCVPGVSPASGRAGHSLPSLLQPGLADKKNQWWRKWDSNLALNPKLLSTDFKRLAQST